MIATASDYFRKMRVWTISLGLTALISAPASAVERESAETSAGVSRHSLVVHGRLLNFVFRRYANELQEQEVAVELVETRALVPYHRVNVLLGRDLDGDGRFDAWFVPQDDEGFRIVEKTAADPDGWDAASELLARYAEEGRLSVVFGGLMLGFKAAASNVAWVEIPIENFFAKIAREQLKLLDLELRVRKIERRNPMDPIVIEMTRLLADAWGEQADKIENFMIVRLPLYTVANILAWEGILKLGDVLGPIVSRTWGRVVVSRPGQFAARMVGRVTAGMSAAALAGFERAQGTLARFGVKVGRAAVARDAVAGIVEAASARVTESIAALSARGRLGRAAAATLVTSGRLIGNGVQRIPYVVWTQSLQIVAEAIVRWKEVQADSAKKVVKNLWAQPGFARDFRFMTVETLAMAAVANGKGSLLQRMGVCAGIAFVDSSIVTFTMESGDLTTRVVDTGWEATFGVGQTAFDMKIMKRFEEQMKSRNSFGGKAKSFLKGYLITGLDQAVGYLGYGYISRFLQQRKQNGDAAIPALPLLPQDIPMDGDEDLGPELIPIFGPA